MGVVLEPPLVFEELFRQHFDDVYRSLARLVGPAAQTADIEDLAQQVFLVAYRSLDQFRGDSKPMTWLYGISCRTVLTFLRGRRRQAKLLRALEALPEATESGLTAEKRLELRNVWRHLLQIKPKKRMVFVLFELEGRSGPEIAEALCIPLKTVWTRLFHARRELQKRLNKTGSGRC